MTETIEATVRRRVVPVVFLTAIAGVQPDIPLGHIGTQVAEAKDVDASTHAPKVEFQWYPTIPGKTVQEVTTETEVAIPFKFRIKERVSLVIFTISKEYRAFGIRIVKRTAHVREGAAISKVDFNVPGGMPLGRHSLVIRVIDSDTGKEIGQGEIPFILLPSGIECLC